MTGNDTATAETALTCTTDKETHFRLCCETPGTAGTGDIQIWVEEHDSTADQVRIPIPEPTPPRNRAERRARKRKRVQPRGFRPK